MAHVSWIRRFATCTGISLAGILLIVALGYVPTIRIAGREAAWSMLLACGVSWLAGCAGSFVLARMTAGAEAHPMQAVLAATAVRFVAVLVMVVPLVLSDTVGRTVFVFWVALSYVLLLIVDTTLAIRLLEKGIGNNA